MIDAYASAATQPDNRKQPETVITPAGPVLKEHVRHVGPGERVQRNEDGSFTIIKNNSSKLHKDSSGRKGE
jgi:hypothetical protein